jgi:hypothetical protein
LLQAALLVTAADTPDSGPVTLQAVSDHLDRFSGSDGKHDPGVLDLVEGQTSAVGHRFQDG